jgi:hypothetical protein
MAKTRLELEAAAREEHKDHLQTPEGEKDRFQYTRKKRSQDDYSIANVVTIKDTLLDRKYTVSVNAQVVSDTEPAEVLPEDLLSDLQAHITKHLLTIHEHL